MRCRMHSCDEPSLRTPVEVELEPIDLTFFVRESNRIEGITRAPTKRELQAHADMLRAGWLTLGVIDDFVRAVAPGKPMRLQPGMNVRVGNHLPPPGGPEVERQLEYILHGASDGADPWDVHVAYETLHPFMDGNGRSGRAIWLWQMIHQQRAPWALRMGFLHLFYYQTLQHSGRNQHNARDGASIPLPTSTLKG